MTNLTVLKNVLLFDGKADEPEENMSVAFEGERIVEIAPGEIVLSDARVIDLGGRFLMPGMLDLHFHAYSATFDFASLDRMPRALLVSHAVKILEACLQRGFTTVRDPGGGDVGLALAVSQGIVQGPRFLYGGKGLSQTGGHGDMRRHDEEPLCGCSYTGATSQVVDGVEAVRKVCREELRKGAHHIKLYISGGASSPTDPIWMPQFTEEEIRAAVEEAQTRRKYVVVHCHTDDGARRSVHCGVRSIDHGTQISADTAEIIAQSGSSYVVPTLAVMHEILDIGPDLGMYPESLEKVRPLLGQALESIENCQRAGVQLGLGTDLFGSEHHHRQSREFVYRSEVSKPIDILKSATSINAQIAQLEGEVGEISVGALADMIVLDANPMDDLSIFQKPELMPMIVKGGDLVRLEL